MVKGIFDRFIGISSGSAYGIYKGLRDFHPSYTQSSTFWKLNPKNHFIFMMSLRYSLLMGIFSSSFSYIDYKFVKSNMKNDLLNKIGSGFLSGLILGAFTSYRKPNKISKLSYASVLGSAYGLFCYFYNPLSYKLYLSFPKIEKKEKDV